MRHKRGFTFLEVVIASAILVALVSAVYLVLAASQGQYERELTLQQGYWDMQVALDGMSADLKESSMQYTRASSFVDPKFPASWLILMPSARNASDAFVTQNTSASWQSIVVYAPSWNPDTDEGDVRRYVVTDAATLAKFTAPSGNPTIAVGPANIVLDGFAVARSGGTKVIRRVSRMTATQSATSWVVSLELAGGLTRSLRMGMETGASGRN